MTSASFQALLSAVAVFGTLLATIGSWLGTGALVSLVLPALLVAYLASELPAAWSALAELRRKRVLDLDLLMVVAALVAATVGASFAVAVLLMLFSVAGMLEDQAMGRARSVIEVPMVLRPGAHVPKGAMGLDRLRLLSDPIRREIPTAGRNRPVRPQRADLRAR